MSGTFYGQSKVMDAIVDAQGQQVDLLVAALVSVQTQTFAATADPWGLDLWDAELALPDWSTVAPPLSIDERRSRILQRLNGARTPTIANIVASIATWNNGQATLYEDIPNYTVWIVFSNGKGLPSNRVVMEAGVRALAPAHLSINFHYGTLVWSDLDAMHLTWAQVDALNVNWDQWEQI